MGTTGEAGEMAVPTIPLGVCYGEEENCDVIFLAGRDEDVWRLPAHKFVLTQVNPVFRAMMEHDEMLRSQSVPHTIPVPDVDCRALDNLLRFLYNEPVPLQSIETALVTLQAADKYICPGLTRVCISYLLDNLNQTNVLSIMKYILVFCGDYQNLQNLSKENEILTETSTDRNEKSSLQSSTVTVSKKPKKEKVTTTQREIFTNTSSSMNVCRNAESEKIENFEIDCAGLLQKCLIYVDRYAEEILASEELEDLDISAIQLILRRDTLNITSEMVVYSAIMRWADKECKRQQKPLTPESKREVLAESVFLPRYLTMNRSDFQASGGPAQSRLFSVDEMRALLTILEENVISASKSSSAVATTITTHNNNSNSQLEEDRLKNLVNSTSACAPISLQPFIHTLLRPRKPVSKASTPSSRFPRKKRKVPVMRRWLCLKNCCKFLRNSDSPSPPSSNQSSPVRSMPFKQNNRKCSDFQRHVRQQEQLQTRPPLPCGARRSSPSTFDSALESIIICWAFFFD